MNYQALYNNVLDYLARDDISFGLFDTWLRIVEKKLNARLMSNADYTTYHTTLNNGSVTLPADFKQGTITKIGNGDIVLQYRTPQAFEEKRNVIGYFTIKNNQLMVSGNVGGAEVTIEYNKKIEPLSSQNPENNISSNYPDLYLSGVLKEASLWSKDANMGQLHTANFESSLSEANADSVAMAISGSQLVMAPDIDYLRGQ